MSTVLITGGSRGIGAAAVELFARLGHRVFFLYEKNHEAARAVEARTGAEGICCDVADGEAVRRAFTRVGAVDILICNAGICQYGLMSMTSEEQWDRIFAVNVKGIYHCVNAAMPGFLEKQSGCVITVSSMWGQAGASCEAAYSATKGAVIALTKALAKELGPSGIRVNCVAPGVILTDMCAQVEPEILEELRQE
jgi:3-oxoacyl-[acyl-carrier protein] reductase